MRTQSNQQSIESRLSQISMRSDISQRIGSTRISSPESIEAEQTAPGIGDVFEKGTQLARYLSGGYQLPSHAASKDLLGQIISLPNNKLPVNAQSIIQRLEGIGQGASIQIPAPFIERPSSEAQNPFAALRILNKVPDQKLNRILDGLKSLQNAEQTYQASTARAAVALASQGYLSGESTVLGKNPADVSVDDILNDKTLSFDEMVFMFFQKVLSSYEQDIKNKMRNIQDRMDRAKSAKGRSEAGQTTIAEGEGKASAAAGGAGKKKSIKNGDKPRRPKRRSKSLLGKIFKSAVDAARGDVVRVVVRLCCSNKSIAKLVSKIGKGLVKVGQFMKKVDKFLNPLKALMRKALPVVMPVIQKVLMAIPGVGPFLSALAPKVLGHVMMGATSGILGQMGSLVEAHGKSLNRTAEGRDDVVPVPLMSEESASSGRSAGGTSSQALATSSTASQASNRPGAVSDAAENSAKGSLEDVEDSTESLNAEMERIKLLVNRMQKMQTLLSNMMASFHQTSMNTIRNIK